MSAVDSDNEIFARVARRLIPFMVLLYFVAFLDRVNVGLAALTMNKDFGLSDVVFSVGAGIFFIGYFLFEVPSNVILERVGAKRWISSHHAELGSGLGGLGVGAGTTELRHDGAGLAALAGGLIVAALVVLSLARAGTSGLVRPRRLSP